MTDLDLVLGFGFIISSVGFASMSRAYWREANRTDAMKKDVCSSEDDVNGWAKAAGDAREELQKVETLLAATRRLLEPSVPSAGGK